MPLAPAQTASNSVFSMLCKQRALYAPVLAIAAFGLVACSGKPENSPVIRKKFAEVDAMKEDLNTAIAELRAATGQMTVIREQVSEIRAFAPDAQGSTAIVSRIEAIENRLTALTTTTTQQRSVAQATTPDQSATRSTTPAPSGAASSSTTTSGFGGLATPATSTATDPASSFREMTNRTTTTTAATTTTTPPARTQTAAAPRPTTPAQTGTGASTPTTQSQPANRGRYYTIETGDTLEKIARDNNTSVDALREANRLPAGARPLKGQRLFIPPAR